MWKALIVGRHSVSSVHQLATSTVSTLTKDTKITVDKNVLSRLSRKSPLAHPPHCNVNCRKLNTVSPWQRCRYSSCLSLLHPRRMICIFLCMTCVCLSVCLSVSTITQKVDDDKLL